MEKGFLEETRLLKISKLDDFDGNFDLGFVYATENGRLAYFNNDGQLKQIAILQNIPDLDSSNVRVC